MRRAPKLDANQGEIVSALRALGYSVQTLAGVGGGVPDLLVGWRGVNILLEIKDGSKVPSRRCLTADEQLWHARWLGQVAVVNSVEEAIRAVGEVLRGRVG